MTEEEIIAQWDALADERDRLKAENERLRNIIKKLVTAGDKMYNSARYDPSIDEADCLVSDEAIQDVLAALDEAKEDAVDADQTGE